MKRKALHSALICISIVSVLSACTQMPTEKTAIADMRPQISFKGADSVINSGWVLVDGLGIGMVSEFVDGKSSARVLPGTHRITVVADGVTILDEKVYLGDGVSRAFLVK